MPKLVISDCTEADAQKAYTHIESHFGGKVDAVYQDAIIDLVGEKGLTLLRKYHLIETCAVFNGRKLYAF